MLNHIEKVLQKSNMKKEDITKIFLIGGSSKIPRIQQIIKKFFLNKLEIHIDNNPEEKAAIGIAKYANYFKKLEYMMIHPEIILIGNLKQSIGIGTYDGNNIILFDKNDDGNYFIYHKSFNNPLTNNSTLTDTPILSFSMTVFNTNDI